MSYPKFLPTSTLTILAIHVNQHIVQVTAHKKALLKDVDDVFLSLNKYNISVLASLDFSSAFDTIDHLSLYIYIYIYIQYARTQSKKCTFSRRSAPVWNTKLSQLTKCCTNVNFFKRLLDNDTFFIENKFYFDQY